MMISSDTCSTQKIKLLAKYRTTVSGGCTPPPPISHIHVQSQRFGKDNRKENKRKGKTKAEENSRKVEIRKVEPTDW
jgi:hypothetical protein